MAGLSGDEWARTRDAIRRYQSAVKSLGEIDPAAKITYFEASPTKSAECQKRWQELNDAGRSLTEIVAELSP